MNVMYHARSCVTKWGGQPGDYLAIQEFMDSSKLVVPDVRHRALYHHTHGCFLVERIFGVTFTNSSGRMVPSREVAERHVIEDLGWLPTIRDYLDGMPISPWMSGRRFRPVDPALLGVALTEKEFVPA